MSDLNTLHNRVVWFDIAVNDLKRATQFYAKVLGIAVHVESHEGFEFAVLDHTEGNGGCLVPTDDPINTNNAVLLYLNVDGRIEEAVSQVVEWGGEILEPIHAIGPYGRRAIIIDSEGNRVALHTTNDSQ